MYHCNDCKRNFDYVKIVYEDRGLVGGQSEKVFLCPFCDSTSFTEEKGNYCKCCGRNLGNSKKDYCNDSCRRGAIREAKRALEREEKKKTNKLYIALNEVKNYNDRTGSNLSYGQYFAVKGIKRI